MAIIRGSWALITALLSDNSNNTTGTFDPHGRMSMAATLLPGTEAPNKKIVAADQ
jgi:hypothetical protein